MLIMDNEVIVTIRSLILSDIDQFVKSFQEQGWNKPRGLFEQYCAEQKSGRREVFVAEAKGEPVGYTVLLPRAKSGPFAGKYPEIKDFNVLKKAQRQGIGSRILDAAENAAKKYADTITLAVGLYGGYGQAQKIYVKRGYIPDGSGVWYGDQPLAPYADCNNDDDLVLFLWKMLS